METFIERLFSHSGLSRKRIQGNPDGAGCWGPAPARHAAPAWPL